MVIQFFAKHQLVVCVCVFSPLLFLLATKKRRGEQGKGYLTTTQPFPRMCQCERTIPICFGLTTISLPSPAHPPCLCCRRDTSHIDRRGAAAGSRRAMWRSLWRQPKHCTSRHESDLIRFQARRHKQPAVTASFATLV